MFPKKSSILYANASCISSSSLSAGTHLHFHTSVSPKCTSLAYHKKFYTTSRCPDDDAPPWPARTHPTPYDIFAINRKAPYTKKRFYQLVKLYHPDLHTHNPTLSPAVLLERYRLIVAANDLLRDPAKRHLYDTHGLGWSQNSSAALRNKDRAWRQQPGNASMNATWEDWERWYDARNGRKREPVYMGNGHFAIIVAMMCCVGAIAQMNRAESAGHQYMETAMHNNQEAGELVRRSTMASVGLSKDERVDRFLRDRENVSFHFIPGKYEHVRDEGHTEDQLER